MKFRELLLESVGAFGLACTVASIQSFAGEPNCGLNREPSCAVVPGGEGCVIERKLVFVPVPLCHGLKCIPRPWFLTTEPPRADVLEAVAIRRDQAPLTDRDLAFEIIQRDRNLETNRNRDLESTCQNSRRLSEPTRTREALSELDCRMSGTQMQQLKEELNDVNSRVDDIRGDINKLAEAVRDLAQLQRARSAADATHQDPKK